MNSVVDISQSQVPSINITWRKIWSKVMQEIPKKNTQNTQISRKN